MNMHEQLKLHLLDHRRTVQLLTCIKKGVENNYLPHIKSDGAILRNQAFKIIIPIPRNYNGSLFGKRDLLAIFHVMKYDVKYSMCLHKFDCRETTLSNAANHFKIFLIELEICLYKHLYFLYIRNPLFPIAVFISMLLQVEVNMFLSKK